MFGLDKMFLSSMSKHDSKFIRGELPHCFLKVDTLHTGPADLLQTVTYQLCQTRSHASNIAGCVACRPPVSLSGSLVHLSQEGRVS